MKRASIFSFCPTPRSPRSWTAKASSGKKKGEKKTFKRKENDITTTSLYSIFLPHRISFYIFLCLLKKNHKSAYYYFRLYFLYATFVDVAFQILIFAVMKIISKNDMFLQKLLIIIMNGINIKTKQRINRLIHVKYCIDTFLTKLQKTWMQL